MLSLVLGLSFRLGLLLGLSRLLSRLLSGRLLSFLLFSSTAYSTSSCTNCRACSGIVGGDSADGCASCCTYRGTLYCSTLGCCCGCLLRSFFLSSFLLLRTLS